MAFLIDCPHCGPREATEFSFGGEDRRAGRDAADRALADALADRRNVQGWQTEWWRHDAGCRSWLLGERDTRSDEIRRVRAGDRDPEAVTA